MEKIDFKDRIQSNPRLLRLKNPSTGEIIDYEIQDLLEGEIVQDGTEVSGNVLNEMQSNIEESCVIVSPTEPTTNEKVWIDDTNKKIYVKDEEGNFKEFIDLNSRYKLLWENNNPNSQFDGTQTISLNSDDYDLLMWFYKRDKDVDYVASNIIPKGYGGVMGYVNTYDGQNSAFREIIRHSDTTFEISSAFKGAVDMENTQIIPIQVIGVKF